MSNSWVYVRYVNTLTILVLHWVLLSCRSSLTKAALYYLITGLVLALRQKNRKTAKVHLKHERMMLTGNLRQPNITSITGIV